MKSPLKLLAVLAVLATYNVTAETCTQPPAGMVRWYPADGDTNDLIGSNTATLRNGANYAPGMVAQAFSLDGVDDFVEAPDGADLASDSLTIDAWVKLAPTANIANYPALVSKYDSSVPNGTSWALFLYDTGQLAFVVYQDGSGGNTYRYVLTEDPVLTLDVWKHVAATFDVTTQAMQIYVDGAQRSTLLIGGSATITSLTHGSNPVRIGVLVNINAQLTELWQGLIDEVEIFGRALAASEIQAIFNAGSAGKCKTTPDTTPPTFGDCPAGGPLLLNSGLYSVGPITAQDPESGINSGASTLTGTIDTSSVGPKPVTFTAVNNAGLQATKDCEYKVEYNFAGFFQPVDNGILNLAKAGQTIPVKWRLTDANGVPISDPSSFVSVTSSATIGGCGGSADAIETYSGSSASGLQYLGNGNWQYNWKTPKSYAGQCRTLSLNLKDGAAAHFASFKFN